MICRPVRNGWRTHLWVSVVLLWLPVATSAAESPPLRLAASTSLQGSGLLDALVAQFGQTTGLAVEVISVGSGKALNLGRLGLVDVMVVHAPEAERQFVADGHGRLHRPVMRDQFVLVGPASDPAATSDADGITEALQRIATRQARFVSRGDDSGTHRRELALWRRSGDRPFANWYVELGSSMIDALREASARQAYILTDLATWLKVRPESSLRLLVRDDPLLENAYSVIALNPERHSETNAEAAERFVEWLTAAAGQRLIAAFRVGEAHPYTPARSAMATPERDDG